MSVPAMVASQIISSGLGAISANQAKKAQKPLRERLRTLLNAMP